VPGSQDDFPLSEWPYLPALLRLTLALGLGLFYAVSFVGGLVSSASAVASAGVLAQSGTLPSDVAGRGAVIAALASALVNLPLVARIAHERPLTRRIALALGLIVAIGATGAIMGWLFPFADQIDLEALSWLAFRVASRAAR
jgi:uncharacterized membrane protein (DUF4010 family)